MRFLMQALSVSFVQNGASFVNLVVYDCLFEKLDGVLLASILLLLGFQSDSIGLTTQHA
jgi:hypothetical protein